MTQIILRNKIVPKILWDKEGFVLVKVFPELDKYLYL